MSTITNTNSAPSSCKSKIIQYHVDNIKTKVISQTDQKIQVLFSNTHCTLINDIVRTIMDTVPTMRFDHFWSTINTSSMKDEVIAQRVGVIPVAVPNVHYFRYEYEVGLNEQAVMNERIERKTLYEYAYEKDCVLHTERGTTATRPGMPENGTYFVSMEKVNGLYPPHPQTTLVFELDTICTFDTATKNVQHRTVYSRDLKWMPIGNQLEWFQEHGMPNGPMLNPNIPIVQLSDGQHIKGHFWCVKGENREHAKWSAGNAYIREIAQIKVNVTPTPDIEDLRTIQHAIVNSCPKRVFQIQPQTQTIELNNNGFDCNLCMECTKVKKNAVQVYSSQTEYLLTVQSLSCQTASDILHYALTILQRKCQMLTSALTANK